MDLKPLKHIQDGTPPAWTVDWGYENPRKFTKEIRVNGKTIVKSSDNQEINETIRLLRGQTHELTTKWHNEKSWYVGFRNEEDAREFATWYLAGQEHRIYPGSVKLHTKE